MKTVDEWKSTLRAELRAAQLKRASHAVEVLRETLAAIDNAESVDSSAAVPSQEEAFAGSVAGLGAAEAPRRQLSPEDVLEIVEKELQDRREAMATYVTHGRHDEARTLQLQIELLEAIR